MNKASNLHRSEIAAELQKDPFDLLVVGGGITGAGIALDAASRGLKVALVEREDFASGTSSKSTKLIHGGLRYLKNFEFLLVQEVGRERAVVHGLAPHLVVPEKMLLPIMRKGTFGKFSTSIGLWLYDLLAGVKDEDKRRMLSREATVAEEPLVKRPDLLGGGLYAEYRTDDARLTIEVVKTAIRHGALCLNYCPVEDFHYENGKVAGVLCRDALTGNIIPIAARQIVNAAGPWVDELRSKDKSLKGKHLFLSKGVHIVVPHERLPLKHSVYFDVPGGRMMFAIPRHRSTYIGTTDTAYEGRPEDVAADAGDVQYILDGTNAMFPSVNLTTSDVESTWAGLRPLIYEEGKSPGEMSRKDEIFESESGLVSIAGGKLTGYRLMAKKVVDLVLRRRKNHKGDTFGPSRTHHIPLSDQPFANTAEVRQFVNDLHEMVQKAGLPPWKCFSLTEMYGRYAQDIVEAAIQLGGGEEALIRAELHHSLEHELIATALDFYERRSGRLFFEIDSVAPSMDFVIPELKNAFGWPDELALDAASNVNRELTRAKVF
ncbi:MAG: glycerol-3-phosphate dehydrogenase [Saprospiraceae bacterium]